MAKVNNSDWALPNQVITLKAENSLWLIIDEEIKYVPPSLEGSKHQSCELYSGATWQETVGSL